MILNVGPKSRRPDSPPSTGAASPAGQWMDVNWEAIYGSRPWTKTGEDREVRFETDRSPDRLRLGPEQPRCPSLRRTISA